MDELAQGLLTTLKKPTATLDSKLQLFNQLKTNIKHQRVPDSAQPTILEAVRLAIASQTTSALVTVGFSTLSHLIKRLTLQDQAHNVFNHRTQIIPTLLDRLGDAKESYRSAASQSLADLWSARPQDVEKAIKEDALLGSNVRARETAICWVTKMHEEHDLQFKSFVPPLVDCLDHADGTVRECAKNNLVDLFRGAPERAKADLKKQLTTHNVRKSIAAYILSHLDMTVPSELVTAAPAPSHTRTEPAPAPLPPASILSSEAARPAEPVLPPSADTSNIEPLYVDSNRQMEDMFRDMVQHFEGRESEGNWMQRDAAVLKIRRLLRGNAPNDYLTTLVAALKNMLESILKVFNSLRTTMSSNGCSLIQEMTRKLGPAIDSMVEILMQNAIKLCSATKNIAAQNGNSTVDAILSHVTYNVRLVQHIWFAAQEKNVQPRTFASGWLKTIMRRQAPHKSGFDHSGGLELAEKIIKKGLTDATPKVRENMRGTFWTFHATWHDRAETIMNGLDAKSKTLLEKDSANPNASSAAFTSSVGHGAQPGNVRAAVSRTSLKEQIAAQKKAAAAAKRMPDRPNSAMADLSPAKPAAPSRPVSMVSGGSTRSTPGNSRPTTSSTSTTAHNSLMSGPVRRPKKPEVTRPATADPYASVQRRLGRAETPPIRSPGNSPARGGPSHLKTKSSSNLRPGTSESDKPSITTSPRISPGRPRPKTIHGGDTSALMSSPSQSRTLGTSPKAGGDDGGGHSMLPQTKQFAHSRRLSRENERPVSNHSDLPTMVEEEENFTLVMPQKGGALDLSARQTAATEQAREASPKRAATKTPRKGPTGPREASTKKPAAAEPVSAEVPVVYEDPPTAQEEAPAAEEAPKVLEEVTNRQPEVRAAEASQSVSSVEEPVESPLKKTADRPLDGAELQKHRRLLSSGVERLRARTLDAHGFRRLQELVKSAGGGSEAEAHHRGLLVALAEYVEATPEALKVPASKAANLKGQALVTLRGLIALRREEVEVQEQCGRVMCSLLRARQMTERAWSLNAELDKTGLEAVRSSGNSAVDCVDAVMEFGMQLSTAKNSMDQGRTVTASLGLLSQLLAATTKKRGLALGEERIKRLGRLAVSYLDNSEADVRRADTDFCLALHTTFSNEVKGDFWQLLQGAQETQLNLVAYYLARKNKV